MHVERRPARRLSHVCRRYAWRGLCWAPPAPEFHDIQCGLKTNLFRPVTEGEITITSTPINAGRRIIVVQTDITKPDGKLVSRTTQTQAVISLSDS